MQEIWSFCSHENHQICCHQMSHFKAKMHQIEFRLGLRPRPRWGSSSAPPDPLAAIGGSTSKGMGGGKGGEGMGRGKGEGIGKGRGDGKEGEGTVGRKGTGRGGEGSPPILADHFNHWFQALSMAYWWFQKYQAEVANFAPRLGGPTAECFQLRGGPLNPWPGALPLDPAGGSASRLPL